MDFLSCNFPQLQGLLERPELHSVRFGLYVYEKFETQWYIMLNIEGRYVL